MIEKRVVPGSGPIVRDRHESLYTTTAAVSNYHYILDLKYFLFLDQYRNKGPKKSGVNIVIITTFSF